MASAERSRKITNSNRYSNLEVSPEFLQKVKKWTLFYRRYPFRYVEDAMGIKLKVFQKFQLYIMNNWLFSSILASRGLGKTFITAIYVHYRCVVYPNTKVVIASGQISQAMEIVEYIETMKKRSDTVDMEISYISTGKTNPKVDYWNGSTIRVVASTDGSRGKRANLLILDEYRIIPLTIITMVLRKFKSDPRYCGWYDKPEYAEKIKTGELKREQNKEIYLSSTYYKHSWAYKHYLSYLKLMQEGISRMKFNQFTCCLPYQLGVESGIKDIEALQAEYDEGVDEQEWRMEYEAFWIGSDDDKSFFKFDAIDPCRRIKRPIYPKEVLEQVDAKDKYFSKQPKKQGEIRILFADIARKESRIGENDATSAGVMSLTEIDDTRLNNSYFLREVPFIETFTGQNTLVQALRLRELFEWFECDYLVIDAQNIGASIIDLLSLPITNPETGEEYSPINCINHEELKLGTIIYPNAPRKIYGIMATPALNSEIGYAMKDTIQKKRIRLLVDETEGRSELEYIKEFDRLDPELKGLLRQPYLQTTALVSEMIELEYKISPDTNLLRLNEKSGFRKDRYSSVSYANYFANKLEKDLFKKKDIYEDINSFVEFYQF